MAKIKFHFEGESSVLMAILGLAKLEAGDTEGDVNLAEMLEPTPPPVISPVQKQTQVLSLVPEPATPVPANRPFSVPFGTTSALPNAMVADTTGLDHLSPAVPPMPEHHVSAESQFQNFDFGALPLEPEAWATFETFVKAWVVNFDGPTNANHEPLTPQPNRLELLRQLGSCRWTVFILRWCAHYKCLQGAVKAVLKTNDLDYVDKVSATMVQVSHMAFPDLAGFYDDSTRWRRA